jgi:hypothetical protein
MLRAHLKATENSGDRKATASSIGILAPGVYCVIDIYKGKREYDIYFDLDQASFKESYNRANQPDPAGLKEIGFDCLGFGTCSTGFDYIRRFAKENLDLKNGNNWLDVPEQVGA